MNIKHRKTCRICGNPNLTPVIDLGKQFFQGSFVKSDVPEPPKRKTPNEVVRCNTSMFENACGLIQTRHSVPPSILYTNYWYQSGISDTMRKHLASIVNEAINITGISGGTVLDIASNDNTLLRAYPDGFNKVGIDPSNIAARQTDENITLVNDLFPSFRLDKIVSRGVDIVTSIACYYDVEDPKCFAQSVEKLLSENGIWIFEVAYWPSMLRNLAYDSIVNEHIIHYHLAPLEIMLELIGLRIFKAKKTDTNGGSIMCFVSRKNNVKYDTVENIDELKLLRMEEFNSALDEESTYELFRSQVSAQKHALTSLIEKIVSEGKTIHIYGASTKLNTILGYCDIGPSLIPFAAERSPEKHGAKTISGISLISEERSRAMKPDYYLVGPYHFKKEILLREAQAMSNGVKFIFPLPTVEIYPR